MFLKTRNIYLIHAVKMVKMRSRTHVFTEPRLKLGSPTTRIHSFNTLPWAFVRSPPRGLGVKISSEGLRCRMIDPSRVRSSPSLSNSVNFLFGEKYTYTKTISSNRAAMKPGPSLTSQKGTGQLITTVPSPERPLGFLPSCPCHFPIVLPLRLSREQRGLGAIDYRADSVTDFVALGTFKVAA